MTTHITRRLYTPAEAAQMAGLHRHTVYAAITAGDLAVVRLNPGPKARLRITIEALDAWLGGSASAQQQPTR